MKESYAERLGKYLGDWSQDADDKAFVEEAAALEAELSQCLTAHAELNDMNEMHLDYINTQLTPESERVHKLKAQIHKLEDQAEDCTGEQSQESLIVDQRPAWKRAAMECSFAHEHLAIQIIKQLELERDHYKENCALRLKQLETAQIRIKELEDSINQLSCNYMHTDGFCNECGWLPPTTKG